MSGALVALMVLMMETFLWGIIPRIFNVDHVHRLSYAELAEGLVEVDTAGWAEGWEKLSGRIWEGFEAIAKEMEANGGGNALVAAME